MESLSSCATKGPLPPAAPVRPRGYGSWEAQGCWMLSVSLEKMGTPRPMERLLDMLTDHHPILTYVCLLFRTVGAISYLAIFYVTCRRSDPGIAALSSISKYTQHSKAWLEPTPSRCYLSLPEPLTPQTDHRTFPLGASSLSQSTPIGPASSFSLRMVMI